MKLPLIKLFLIQLLLPAISHGQSTTTACKDSSIDAGYYVNNSSLGIGKFITTKDDGKLLITISDFTSITITYSITRLSSNGAIKWNKIIKPANTSEVIKIQNLLELRNGGFIIGGARSFPDFSAPTYFFLLRFDDNGNLLWQHKYKNNYNPPADNAVTAFATLNEGKNGETIGLINYADQGVQSITRFDANGNVVWSDGHNIANLQSLLPDYANIYDGSNINLWGIAAPGPDCLGDVFNQGLAAAQIDYTTGLVAKYKSFCRLSPAMPKLYLSETEGYSFSKKLANKNTVNILTSYTGTLLINVFDDNLNCLKSKLYTPPDMHSNSYQTAYYSFDVSDNGEVSICIQIEYLKSFFTYLTYQPLILLGADLNVKQEYVVHPPGLPIYATPFPLKFTPSGKIAFLAVGYPVFNPNFQSFTLVTMPTNTKASAICFAADTAFGTLSDYGLVANSEVLGNVNIVKNIYSIDGSPNLVISSLPILQATTCSNVSICDTLKIHGNAAYCLNNDTATFTVYRNNQCQRTINWQTDTSIANILSQVNDTTVQLKFKKSGVVWLYAAVNNCVIKDSLKITVNNPKQSFAINKDSILCPGKNIALKASSGFATYLWQDGSILDHLQVTATGFYKVMVTDSCGHIFSDSITVQLADTSFAIPPQQTICNSDTIVIAIPAGISAVVWQPSTSVAASASQLFFYPSQSTYYNISAVKYPNCILRKSILVTVRDCPDNIFFPNSFTPNNDRLNDYFKPTISRPLYFYQLTIFNRYGQRVFETNNPFMGWDGMYKNTEQSHGAYVYQCTYQFKSGLPKYKKGVCILLR